MIQSYKNYFLLGKESNLDNFIQTVLYLVCRKSKYPSKDFTYLYHIIWRFSSLGDKAISFLIEKNIIPFIISYYNKKHNITIKSINKSMEEIMNLSIKISKSKEISTILMNKKERISPFEELFEKKQLEKNQQPTDIHLLQTLLEIIKYLKINSIISDDENSLQFSDPNIIKLLLGETRTKNSTYSLGKVFQLICYDNIDNTNNIGNILCEYIYTLDYSEMEPVLRLFKYFLTIDDKLTNSRVK
jgi:hypothetical protein